MDLILEKSTLKNNQHIVISGSKSETNRLLLLQALFPELQILNASVSDDSRVMTEVLASTKNTVDIHHAGTAMRFLTAYYAVFNPLDEIILTGSSRMKERPIKILVDALTQLGAYITYLEKEGFPPLKIRKAENFTSKIQIPANISSQYISALLLIATKLKNGLTIELIGEITSLPYLKMTVAILNDLGIEVNFTNQIIEVKSTEKLTKTHFVVESDWSSASYFYSFISLSAVGSKVTLSSFKQSSLQGDAVLADIYKNFGVQTTFNEHTITLEKVENHKVDFVHFNLNNAPDIAQTIAITCLGLQMKCKLTRLHTLKIKETDRLVALKTEIEKFGANVFINNDSFELQNTVLFEKQNIEIETYQDHRMAMAFAPLSLKQTIKIKDSEVVSKSYPSFWQDIKAIGVFVKK